MVDDIVIVIPTHSSYKTIVLNFLQLFEKNWKDCPYKIVISICGENIQFEGLNTIYNGENTSLIECISNAVKLFDARYYMCFLGDAFINKKIDTKEFLKDFNEISNKAIDYCCLNYVKRYKKEKKFNNKFRYINSKDRYSHSFVAFIASKKFMTKDLVDFDSDLSFEKYYLNDKKSFYYSNHIIVRKNYFAILPGITKGKWDRINFHILQKSNPEIDFDSREIEPFINTVLNFLRKKFINKIPRSLRVLSKKIIKKVFNIQFATND